jgi:hypothetical protein
MPVRSPAERARERRKNYEARVRRMNAEPPKPKAAAAPPAPPAPPQPPQPPKPSIGTTVAGALGLGKKEEKKEQ